MIQFFGLHLGEEAASVVALGRDLKPWARARAALMNVTRDEAGGAQVPPAEWVRSGAYALQEAYFQLPVKARKGWGAGLSGPSGWIALDFDFEPLSPLRLTGDTDALADLAAWVAKDPRLARHVSAVLSPKDYFRFAMSGGLAADVTSASRLGLLAEGRSQWSEEKVAQRGLRLSWLPPVFDSHVTTGRLSEEGMRHSSLPGGFWLVAGAHEREAELLASGDLRDRRLWVRGGAGGRSYVAVGIDGLGPVTRPPGWSLVRSAMAGMQLLEKPIARIEDGAALEESPAVACARQELLDAGIEVRGAAHAGGAAEAGAAALAAIGSNLVKGWDLYYKNREAEPPAPAGP
jgi:sugar (pentulose or hexulose) kinase